MTNFTPEQYRALSDLDALDYRFHMNDVRTALRTAADQLEAVRALHRHDIGGEFWVAASPLDAILTAGTAPQEGRNE